jgi:hypothetical protein
MRYRQIHLDFHTAGEIPGIGSRFNAEAFAEAFKEAHVDSVNLFAKCHHGYSYHPTEVGTMHPNLNFDLLGAQIEALQSVDIKTPIYVSATWDEFSANTHPEWRIVRPDGTLPRHKTEPNAAGWAYMDYASPYLDYLCRQVEEVMQLYPQGDGLWIDICWQPISVSVAARHKMNEMGLDWTNEEDRKTFNTYIVGHFYDRINDVVQRNNPDCPLFFNESHLRRGYRSHYHDHFTHLELESLPTSGWGYDHFPLSARYADQLGMNFLGMTGKFHSSWGEVGGYKTSDALLYECGAMLAHGARCNIGDHLHPTAGIDRSTMGVIAPAYKMVEELEPWATGSTNRAEIALLSTEAMKPQRLGERPDTDNFVDEGAVRILLEGQFTFDVVDMKSDFSQYRLLILPDEIDVTPELKAKVDAFTAQNGRVLLTGKSGLSESGFIWDLGADWKGTSPMSKGDYLLPIEPLRADGINDPYFMYLPSEQITVRDGDSLGDVYEPYFDRTPRQFSGHVNAPSKPEPSGYAAGVQKGAFTYLASPIFTAYRKVGAVRMLEIAENLIRLALGDRKMLTTSLPRAGRATLRHQPEHNRDMVHLLCATPALRGFLRRSNVEPIQDLIVLHDVDVKVEGSRPVASVRLVPEMTELSFGQEDQEVTFTVPKMRGHQVVELTYR